MAWNAESANKILKDYKNVNLIPNNKIYAYELKFSGNLLHLAIAKEKKDGEISVYVNRLSIIGEQYKVGVINGITVADSYDPKKTSIRGSVSRLDTLNPKNHNVLLLHVDNPIAFENLFKWYMGLSTNSPIIETAIELSDVRSHTTSADKEEFYIEEIEPQFARYQVDPEKRKCIENYAVDWATKHYEMQGFLVIEKGKPFDLLCTKGDLIIHVEAKGTTGPATAVILTRNEVTDAKNKNWQSDLFIVCNIITVRDGEIWLASGGTERIFEKWEPEDKSLIPLCYEYLVPSR